MTESYRRITVKDLVDLVKLNPKEFPKGLDTAILSGDFEGNTAHEKHEIMRDSQDPQIGPAIFLGFEFHENFYDEMED